MAEVRYGRRHNGKLVRVVAINKAGALVQLVDVDDQDRIVESGQFVTLSQGVLVAVPTPEEIRQQVAKLKAKQLADLKAKVVRQPPEPSIREYPATVFFDHRGWDT